MISKESIIAYTKTLPMAGSDCPFEDDFETTILRHMTNRKWFGALLKVSPAVLGLSGTSPVQILNLKCAPEEKYTLFEAYSDILPAYHMNKVHWITVNLDGSIPEKTVQRLIDNSYALTAPKIRRKKKD